MDADFINLYLEKLNAHINDLTSKNIITETRLTHQSKTVESLTSQVEDLTKQLERAKKKTASAE